MDRDRQQVGTFTLTEAREFEQAQECAAWHRRIRVEPGTYPVEVVGHYWICVAMPGTVTSSDFTSRLGASWGKPKIDEDKGQPATAHIQTWPYAVDGVPGWDIDREKVNRILGYQAMKGGRPPVFVQAEGNVEIR